MLLLGFLLVLLDLLRGEFRLAFGLLGGGELERGGLDGGGEGGVVDREGGRGGGLEVEGEDVGEGGRGVGDAGGDVGEDSVEVGEEFSGSVEGGGTDLDGAVVVQCGE